MNRFLVSGVLLLATLAIAPAANAMLVDPVAVSAQACTMTGDGGADSLGGTAGRDVMCGLGGRDRLRGNGGHDVVLGGGGSDLLQGKGGSDRLDGGPGNDRAFGGAGADDMRGSSGNDILGGGLGPDGLSGGSGRDIVVYGQRGAPVIVTIGAGANDGVAGERDNVKADVESVQGGRSNDALTGNGRSNRLFGGGGKDRLRGKGGRDVLIAGDGDDSIDAREGATATGRAAQTGAVDRVVCGGGNDTALVDPVDAVDPDCENVVGAGASTPPQDPPVQNPPAQDPPAQNPPAPTRPGEPTITTTVAPLDFTEGDPATLVDPGLTVADADDADLEGATVEISAGLQSADELLFTDQLGIMGDYDPATGVLTLTGTSSVANYQAALRSVQYRHTGNSPSAAKTVEFQAADDDGSGPGAARDIAVQTVDDPPTAVNDTATVAESSAASAVDVLANDTDVDGGSKTIAAVTQSTNGTVAITGGGTGLAYQPNAGYCNAAPGTPGDTFTYTLNGGSTATVTVTVTCSDDPPVAVADAATVGEDSAASAIDVLSNDTDSDGGPKTVTSVTQPTNGAVVITGGGTGLTYQPAANYCNATPDSFTYTLNGGSIATVSITVTCVDDAPSAVADSATVVEDLGASALDVLANDSDPDAGAKTIASASDPASGAVVLTGGAAGAHTGLTYQPDANYCGPDTFSYTLNGGSTATVSMTVTCVPDNPVVDTSAGSTSYTENAAATVIDAAITVGDVDGGATIAGATVEISDNFAGSEDVLTLGGTHPAITPVFAGDTLTLTGDATAAAYQAALRDVTYRNSSDSPSTTARTMTFTVTDDTARSASDTKGITVAAVDDLPSAVNDSATVVEDAAASARRRAGQ